MQVAEGGPIEVLRAKAVGEVAVVLPRGAVAHDGPVGVRVVGAEGQVPAAGKVDRLARGVGAPVRTAAKKPDPRGEGGGAEARAGLAAEVTGAGAAGTPPDWRSSP